MNAHDNYLVLATFRVPPPRVPTPAAMLRVTPAPASTPTQTPAPRPPPLPHLLAGTVQVISRVIRLVMDGCITSVRRHTNYILWFWSMWGLWE